MNETGNYSCSCGRYCGVKFKDVVCPECNTPVNLQQGKMTWPADEQGRPQCGVLHPMPSPGREHWHPERDPAKWAHAGARQGKSATTRWCPNCQREWDAGAPGVVENLLDD